MLGAELGYDLSNGKLDKYTASIALDRPREKVVVQMYVCDAISLFLG
jgi:hypothetical protein